MPSRDDNEKAKIIETIFAHIPKEAEITRIDFEGPRLAIYTKRMDILVERSYIISDIANLIHKRIVVRSDPSTRAPEHETVAFIKKIVPPEANITDISFDPTVGEVIIETEKPGLLIGKNWVTLQQIIKNTRWRARVLRAPTIPSKVVVHIRRYLHRKAAERERILRSVGERVFRSSFFKGGEVRVTGLGGFQQVGRSAIIVQTKEGSILLDCGINPGSTVNIEAFPRLDVSEFDLERLEAVVITHAHLDHCGFLPFLYKYGYDGPVYCSEPTLSFMTLLQLDYLRVLASEGRPLPYGEEDVREVILHTIPLSYGTVIDVSPDMKVTLHNAGHILGSAIVHVHIGEGLHNIVYTGDYKFMRSELLESAVTNFPRVETLISESTYGGPEDIMPPRIEAENRLISIVNETIEKGGKVLIPSLAVGRSQEIMLILDRCIRDGRIKEVPIFMEGMISEATAIHTAYPEYLSRELSSKILHQGIDPFRSEYFVHVKSPNERPSVIEGGPSVILATSGMLEGGPVLDYFRNLAPDERNTIIFVSYQIEGTLGSRIQHGLREISLMDEAGKMEVIKVNARIEPIEGFSGHSDRNQILAYLRRVTPRPQRIIFCHGEKTKCTSISSIVNKMFRVEVSAPVGLESIRLR